MSQTYTERVWFALLNAGTRQTGKSATLTLRIIRSSDKYGYDWSDASFKASGWTTLNKTATEHDAVNNQGSYYWDIGASATIDHLLPAAFAVDDEYIFEVEESTLPHHQSYHQVIRKRRMAEMLSAQFFTNNKKLSSGSSGNFIVYEDDASTTLLSKSIKDVDGGAVTIPTGIPAREE